ncbi:hypothetical protein J1605_019070 [Eschrichtius robustus]|uniref:Uncharacterized protein n=1 Tax=Eschrichtius robustus TaxID=9764 RepID=A0AB34HPF2_ESCRO|nr:hypothetical protein J1605_019070 [Eschrichtius robustus]
MQGTRVRALVWEDPTCHGATRPYWGFPGGAVVENLPASAGDTGSSPGLGRSHMLRSNWAREPQLLSLRVWSLCSATREAAIVRGFAGGAVVKNPPAKCRGHAFEPWSGKIPHAEEQLSPCATTTEPAL